MAHLSSSLTPTRLRAVLVAAMVLLLAIGVAGFYFGQKTLSTYATDVSAKVAEAEASNDSVSQLTELEAELDRLSDVRSRASSIVAQSQSYQYQDQIIADLNNYAQQAGITISQFSFQAETAAGAAGAAPTAPAPASPAAGGTPPVATPAPSTGGVKSTTVNITLNPPISYQNLLKFVRSIEQNLTKMQIAGVSLTPGDDANTVSTDALNIEVYVK